MKITSVEVIPYRVPYREVHKITTLTLSALENAIVRIRTDEGVEGIGECVAEAKWNSLVLEAHTVYVGKYLGPAIVGMDPMNIRAIWKRMDKVMNGHDAAKAGIDMALHDLIGKALNVPIWRYLGGSNETPIQVEGPGFGIGFMEPKKAVDLALLGISEGCKQIEIKCGHPAGPAHDIAVVEAVHLACGPDVSLKVDCTEGYDLKSALVTLQRFAELGVDWVEQPLPRHLLADTKTLRDQVTTKIALEESVGSPGDVLKVGAMGAADGIHVKLAMLGGITKGRDIAAICQASGLGVLPGSSTPSGVGLAAVHHFAASVETARGCHASPLARTKDDIITEPLSAYPAEVVLTEKPGLGVDIDWDKLKSFAIEM